MRTIRGILAASGFDPVPWNPHSAGLLFVASSGFSEWHSSHCTGHWDRGDWPEKIVSGGKQWLKAAHKCLQFSFGPLTPHLPARQSPVRPAPLSNILISRKNNNVQGCFNWNERPRKDPKAALSTSRCSHTAHDNRTVTFLFNVVQIKQHSYLVPWGAWRPADGQVRGEFQRVGLEKRRLLIYTLMLILQLFPLSQYIFSVICEYKALDKLWHTET